LIWVMFFVNFFILNIMIWLPKRITMMGYSLTRSLLLTALMPLGVCLSTIIVGQVAAKLGYKNALVLLYAATGLFLFLLSVKTNSVIFGICVFCFGTAGALQNLMFPFASANYPLSVRATGAGMGACMTRFGGVVSPIVVGMLVAAGTSPIGIYRFLMIPVGMGVVAALLTKRPKFDVHDLALTGKRAARGKPA